MTGIYVGNDVVDLEQQRTEGRASDERFVGRVFDADERAAIRDALDPDLELWARWAAKETGFKIISKLIGSPPPFVHRAFKVEWAEKPDAPDAVEDRLLRVGHVTYAEYQANVRVMWGAGRVHAVGFGDPAGGRRQAPILPHVALLEESDSPWSDPYEELRGRFTERELDAVYSKHSAAVRLGARAELARTLAVDESRIEIVCDAGPTSQRPPRVLLDGQRAEADVSLSHDGRWIAWVLWVGTLTETR